MKTLFLTIALAAQCGAAYTYSRTITTDPTKVSTNDQANFPMLVAGTFNGSGSLVPDLRTTANGGKVQNSSGFDVGFFTNSDCSTGKLKWETDSWSASTGNAVYWVKISSLSHTVATVIYLCYGDSSITTDQSDKTNVWDANFKGVWHLANGSSLSGADSTSTGSACTVINATATSGQINGAASLNGTNALLNCGNTISLTNPLTVEFWAVATSVGTTALVTVSKGYDGTNTQWIVATDLTNGVKMQFDANIAGAHHGVTSSTSISTSVLQYWVVTYDGTTYRIFVNGVADGTSTDSTAPPSTTNKLEIGAVDVAGIFDTTFWPGKIDEVRVSNSARPVDWLLTSYNSQGAPSSFYTIGAEVGGATTSRKNRVISQ